MLKRAAENRERKTAECTPKTTTSGDACSRGQGRKSRQHWRSGQKKSQPIRVGILVNGGGGRNRTAVRRYLMPGTTCLARCLISDDGNTTCEARRHPHPLWFRSQLTGRRRHLSRDNDPTSTSTGTSGFGAYALSGESVDVVVGVWVFAAGLSRKATPSACAVRSRNPPSKPVHPRETVDVADTPSIGTGAAFTSAKLKRSPTRTRTAWRPVFLVAVPSRLMSPAAAGGSPRDG